MLNISSTSFRLAVKLRKSEEGGRARVVREGTSVAVAVVATVHGGRGVAGGGEGGVEFVEVVEFGKGEVIDIGVGAKGGEVKMVGGEVEMGGGEEEEENSELREEVEPNVDDERWADSADGSADEKDARHKDGGK